MADVSVPMSVHEWDSPSTFPFTFWVHLSIERFSPVAVSRWASINDRRWDFWQGKALGAESSLFPCSSLPLFLFSWIRQDELNGLEQKRLESMWARKLEALNSSEELFLHVHVFEWCIRMGISMGLQSSSGCGTWWFMSDVIRLFRFSSPSLIFPIKLKPKRKSQTQTSAMQIRCQKLIRQREWISLAFPSKWDSPLESNECKHINISFEFATSFNHFTRSWSRFWARPSHLPHVAFDLKLFLFRYSKQQQVFLAHKQNSRPQSSQIGSAHAEVDKRSAILELIICMLH